MPSSPRSLLLMALLIPLAPAGAGAAGLCPEGGGDGADCAGVPAALPLLAWRDYGPYGPPDEYRGRGGYGYDSRGYYDRGQYQPPPRQAPLPPPQSYPGGVRPTCAAGTHLEGWDCVRDPSGPAIIDQSRQGCPPDYHTNRKGTKCIRNGYQE